LWFWLWFNRSVTGNTYCSFFKIGSIEMCLSPATSIRQKLNSHSATLKHRIGILIGTLSDVFKRLCIDSRSDRNPPIAMVRKNQPCRLNANADRGCNRLYSEITFSHKALPVLFATPFFLVKQSYRRHQ
jgi:hypothetical protein